MGWGRAGAEGREGEGDGRGSEGRQQAEAGRWSLSEVAPPPASSGRWFRLRGGGGLLRATPAPVAPSELALALDLPFSPRPRSTSRPRHPSYPTSTLNSLPQLPLPTNPQHDPSSRSVKGRRRLVRAFARCPAPVLTISPLALLQLTLSPPPFPPAHRSAGSGAPPTRPEPSRRSSRATPRSSPRTATPSPATAVRPPSPPLLAFLLSASSSTGRLRDGTLTLTPARATGDRREGPRRRHQAERQEPRHQGALACRASAAARPLAQCLAHAR